jgi:hypothetical protein
VEHFGDLEQPPGADPVGAFFIFLNLLERDAKGLAESLLD